MEKVEEGSQKSTEEDVEKSSNNPPWVELLDSLIELIIEKLPVVDYIRFGVICKQWRSIQKEHRLRHSPKPPPVADSVFLVNYKFYWDEITWKNDRQLFLCHSPFELDDKKYCISLPYLNSVSIIDSCCGWILTLRYDHPECFIHLEIYNPVTGVIVQLPQLNLDSHSAAMFATAESGFMSAPPTWTNCCIIVTTYDVTTYEKVFVHQLGELGWKKVQVTHNNSAKNLAGRKSNRYVYFEGILYQISNLNYSLYTIDPFPVEPIEHNLEINSEEIIMTFEYNDTIEDKIENLVVIDGQLFLVIARCIRGTNIKKEILLFRANFIEKKWISMTSIGDHVIFLSDNARRDNARSLPVNHIEGFKKNMIYFTQKFYTDHKTDEFRIAWMTFDMDNKQLFEGPSFLYDKEEADLDDNGNYVEKTFMLFWFFPTL